MMTYIPHDSPARTDSAAAIRACGLDWTAEIVPTFTADGIKTPARAVVRSDSRDFLGIVGGKFAPLQNRDLVASLDPLVAAGLIKYDRAGIFRGGAIVALQADIVGATDEIAPGDGVKSTLLVANGHAGKLEVSMGDTDDRFVCQNTLHAALMSTEASGRLLTARHTGDVVAKVDAIRDLVAVKIATFRARCEEWRAMARAPIRSQDELTAYFMTVAVAGKSGAVAALASGDDDKVPAARTVAALQAAFDAPRGANMLPARSNAGMWWKAFNAVTEWTTHQRGRTAESSLESALFGPSARTVEFAHRTALRFARP